MALISEKLSSLSPRWSHPRWRRLLPVLIPLVVVWVLMIFASVTLYDHYGAFWRDEISSIIIAQHPTLADMYANLERDSAPLLFACLVKIWIILGLGESNSGLALLGFIVYGGIGGAVYWAARQLGVRLPLFGSVFLLLNGILFFWGTSIRSYGLASLLAAILIGCIWRFVSSGSLRWWLTTTLVAVLCAQANYQNTYVIFSVCTAATIVCSVRRKWRRSASTLLIGICAAVSLIPYYPIVAKAAVWTAMWAPSPFDPVLLFTTLLSTMGSGRLWLGFLWMTLPVFLVTAACHWSWKAWRQHVPLGVHSGRILFAGMTIVLLVLSMNLFTWKSHHVMQPWYYLPGCTVFACFFDLQLQLFYRRRFGTYAVAGVATLLLFLQTPILLSCSGLRRTNLDVVAAQIGEQAVQGDFIVIAPYWLEHAFKYYYHGVAEWKVVPGLTSQNIERMDVPSILLLLRSPQTVSQSLFQEIERTLRSGHRVWVVGGDTQTQPEKELSSNSGIDDCTIYWCSMITRFFRQHATSRLSLQLKLGTVVEDMDVQLYTGWSEQNP